MSMLPYMDIFFEDSSNEMFHLVNDGDPLIIIEHFNI